MHGLKSSDNDELTSITPNPNAFSSSSNTPSKRSYRLLHPNLIDSPRGTEELPLLIGPNFDNTSHPSPKQNLPSGELPSFLTKLGFSHYFQQTPNAADPLTITSPKRPTPRKKNQNPISPVRKRTRYNSPVVEKILTQNQQQLALARNRIKALEPQIKVIFRLKKIADRYNNNMTALLKEKIDDQPYQNVEDSQHETIFRLKKMADRYKNYITALLKKNMENHDSIDITALLKKKTENQDSIDAQPYLNVDDIQQIVGIKRQYPIMTENRSLFQTMQDDVYSKTTPNEKTTNSTLPRNEKRFTPSEASSPPESPLQPTRSQTPPPPTTRNEFPLTQNQHSASPPSKAERKRRTSIFSSLTPFDFLFVHRNLFGLTRHRKQVLCLAEASFIFSVALLNELKKNDIFKDNALTSTELESLDTLRKRYPGSDGQESEVDTNIRILKANGVTVMHGVDIANLDKQFQQRKFDIIYLPFIFCHTEDGAPAEHLIPGLVERFFMACRSIIAEDGEIRMITPKAPQHYSYGLDSGKPQEAGFDRTHSETFQQDEKCILPDFSHRTSVLGSTPYFGASDGSDLHIYKKISGAALGRFDENFHSPSTLRHCHDARQALSSEDLALAQILAEKYGNSETIKFFAQPLSKIPIKQSPILNSTSISSPSSLTSSHQGLFSNEISTPSTQLRTSLTSSSSLTSSRQELFTNEISSPSTQLRTSLTSYSGDFFNRSQSRCRTELSVRSPTQVYRDATKIPT